MKIVSSPREMRRLSDGWRRRGASVGFVPTMGALHAGHLSLLAAARKAGGVVVASLFINPTQFGPREDLARYPRPFRRDAALCRRAGVDVLFRPSPAALYPPGYDTWVEVENLSRPLCGAFRPGHFRGVATVVLKLFLLVQPDRAYFGAKDYQQLRVVQRLAADLHLPVRVLGLPTVREPDGLPLSSRNAFLSPAGRRAASRAAAALQAGAKLLASARPVSVGDWRRATRAALSRVPGVRVQYLELSDPETLAPLTRVRGRLLASSAIFVGKTRLIDNVLINHA